MKKLTCIFMSQGLLGSVLSNLLIISRIHRWCVMAIYYGSPRK